MRIAFVYDAIYPWATGGAERRFHELGKRLSDRHDVHFIGWQWWDGEPTLRHEGVTLHGIGRAPSLYGGDGKRTVREAVAFSTRLVPFLLRTRWDVIDCSATPYLPLYATWLATRFRRTRLVATWHEFWGDHWIEYLPHRPAVARVAQLIEAGGRRVGDRVVAVSPFTANAMGMAGDRRLDVVPNGVDVGALTDHGGDGPAAEASTTDLVFIGRLIDEKRLDLVLEAMHRLEPRFPELSLAVVGDGPELARLRARAAELALGDRVRFHGRVPTSDIARHLRGAGILVMPSEREGYAMAVAEAQAAGVVPVVARGRYSAAADLVRDGVDGLVVDPDPEAFADAIEALLADPDRRAALGRAAAIAGAARDWEHVGARMETIYLGGSPDGPATATTSRTLEWS